MNIYIDKMNEIVYFYVAEVLELLEKGNISSLSPRHPNNVLGQPKNLRKGAVAKLPNGHFPTTINVTATTVTAPCPNDLSPNPIPRTNSNHQQVQPSNSISDFYFSFGHRSNISKASKIKQEN